MNVEKSKKIRDILYITFALYFFGLFGAGPLALIMHYDDQHTTQVTSKFVTPDWFYFAFAFGLPLIIVFVGWPLILRETRYRSRDPYRFSRRQFRYLDVPDKDIHKLQDKLNELGYIIVNSLLDSNQIKVTGHRIRPLRLERFREKKHPLPHRITISGTPGDTFWSVTIEGTPLSRVVLADFRNTVYDSIEELIDVLNWRPYLKVQAQTS